MIVYEALNITTGRRYIGCTSRSLEKRKIEHLSYSKKKKYSFYEAIRQYGLEGFQWKILRVCKTLEEMYSWEESFVRLYKTNSSLFGYNNTEGGLGTTGHIVSEEHKRILSEFNKGRIVTENTKSKLRKNAIDGEHFKHFVSWWKGKQHTVEHRAKISLARKGKKTRPKTEEERRALSEIRRKLASPGYGGCKVPPNDASEILARVQAGERMKVIANEYGVTVPCVSYYIKRHKKRLVA